MPQLLALQWNAREIGIAVASGRGRQVVVEHALTIARGEQEKGQSAEQLGRRIAEELDARGIGRPEVLVAVGRGSIELRQIQLPPAPDEDLPEMVRFQAAREFNEFDDRWRLDFVPLDAAPDGPRTVLTTAIAPATVAEIEEVCRHAGLTLRRLLLRPCETASLVAARGGAAQSRQLLIELLGEEADLTVAVGDKPVFLRTTRLASDPPPLPALLAEIRLTMAAARNQLGGEAVDSLVICGREPVHAELAQRIESELGLRVTLLDPLAGFELGPKLRDDPPRHPGRFASLLGMLLAELKSAGHAIDFLHPRKRPEPPSRRRLWIIAGAAAAALVLGYLLYARIDHFLLAQEVDALKAQLKSLDDSLAKGEKTRQATAEIGRWADQETIWLDQLYALSQGFPPAEDAMLGELSLGVGQHGSQIDLKGWVRAAEVFDRMEQRVRARSGKINQKISREDRSVKPYARQFEASVFLEKEPGP